ncbi:hypothetical protein MIR68_010573 [Amoeboaphelidium protococcarum]|nr:hypothetical protein MIR68_010573 [Amoeboaphelidium protococcarum]
MRYPYYSSGLWLATILVIISPLYQVFAVKEHDFKKCSQSGFCTRNRAYAVDVEQKQSASPYEVVPQSVQFSQDQVMGEIIKTSVQPHVKLMFTLQFLQDGNVVRMRMDEKGGVRERYKVPDVIIEESLKASSYDKKEMDGGLQFTFGQRNQLKAFIQFKPFRVDYYVEDNLVAVINKFGYMNIEETRLKPEDYVTPPQEDLLHQNEYEEYFKEHQDTKKYGPSSIALDVTFPGANNVYGLPEHATNLSLKDTHGQTEQSYREPYRLYNLDVFEFNLDSPMALYGSVPLLYAHKKTKTSHNTVGFFWLNSAETWVDVKKMVRSGSKLTVQDLYSGESDVGSESGSEVDTMAHWISESGVFDFFLLLGPSPRNVQIQYAALTGTQVMPPLFSLAYHQCRWNYNDEQDVLGVNDNFETHQIPMDVIWLDIEHTNEKQYFTWKTDKFPNPLDMLKKIASFGRKMITIIDPHIKRIEGYHVKDLFSSKGLFVRNRDGQEYEGWCWPGASSYVDFCNPEARSLWSRLFSYSSYGGSFENLFTWNDMNEPSVFNGPEITMPKDNLHFKDVEHREIHNIYGLYLHRSTYAGHVYRSLPQQQVQSGTISPSEWSNRTDLMHGSLPHRPFILSRAFFSGTQRYGAIWNGDNMAKWEHLESSIPMLLSISMGGIGFCGADVGGFFGDVHAELITRWYQAGIFYPFFRAHGHIDTQRREPWVYGEPYISIIRDAIRLRYRLLPYWYTLFRHAQYEGITPLRAIFMEFPDDAETFKMEQQFMVGGALMTKSVYVPLVEGGDRVSMYLPGSNLWFNFHTQIAYQPKLGDSARNRVHQFNVPLSSPLPLLMRAGYTIATRDRVRRSSLLMAKDPYTVTITLNQKRVSLGELYHDDGESFLYAVRGQFVHKTIMTKLTDSQLVIQSRDFVYRGDDGKPLKRMKAYQRPFLMEDGAVNDQGQPLNVKDIERQMTFVSDPEYQKSINDNIQVERIVLLSADTESAMLKLQKSIAEQKVKMIIESADGNNTEVVDSHLLLTIDHIQQSTLHGDEVAGKTEGVVGTYRLTIKKPNVGIGLDWAIKVSI